MGVRLWVVCLAAVAPLFGQEDADKDKRVIVSPAQEFALGERQREEFLRNHPLSPDGNLVVHVDQVGRRVARFSDRPDLPYRFLLLQGSDPQAYSFVGGTICVTEGLARLLSAEGELAFLLGHEMAHVALRHHVSRLRLEQSLRAGLPEEEAMLAAVVSRFDQDQEMEADRYGALYAIRAGNRFSSAQRVLEKVARARSGPGSDGAHPEYAERITALAGFQEELELSLQSFAEGTEALMAGRHDEAIAALQFFVAQFPQSAPGQVNLGAAYLAKVRADAGTPLGLAEALAVLPDPGIVLRGSFDATDLAEARRHFQLALESNPSEPSAMAGLALVHMRLEDLDTARDYLERAVANDPNRPDILLCMGNVDYLAGKYEAATVRYQAALGLRGGWPDAEKNLALAYEKLGRKDDARALWSTLAREKKYRALALRRLDALGGEKPPR